MSCPLSIWYQAATLCAPSAFSPFRRQSPLECLMQSTACRYYIFDSQIPLPPSNLSSLNSAHLLGPTSSRLGFLDGTQLVGSVARHANVVIALEDKLNVTKFES